MILPEHDHESLSVRDITLGELIRSVGRLETAVTSMSGQMQNALGPVGELKARITRAEQDIDGLGEKVEDVKAQAARLSGGLGLLAFVAAMIPWPWRH